MKNSQGSTPLEYRSGVGIMLINKHNKVFVGKRIDQTSGFDAWQMPQGGIDPNESPIDAANRELLEEVGIKSAVLVAEHSQWLIYDLPKELIGQVWGGKYRGQKQKWFLMQFTGEDNLININTHTPEFNAWKWEDIGNLIPNIVPFKRNLYRKIIAEFAPIIEKF
jgi:putative (di)nucleoside polyphosphate hydrolase